jgi:hypothetical protein
MTVREIAELLRSGEMKLDYAGHDVYRDLEETLERHDENVAMSNGANDGKWSKNFHDKNENVDRGCILRSCFWRGVRICRSVLYCF